MAEHSKIQWTDSTLNFWTGCTKVSPGCKYCYMYRDQERYGKDPTQVIKVKDATIKKVLKAAKPGDKIFVNSWSDFFIEDADQWRNEAWDIIRAHPNLIWQILTKRPERVHKCLPVDWYNGWANVWLGVSVENQEQLDKRGWLLCELPAKVRFLSVEPILANVDLTPLFMDYYKGIDWVIVGGESGNNVGKYRYRKSAMQYYTDIVKTCKLHKVPVFVKQLGTHLAKELNLSDRHGGNIEEFPRLLKVREFPNTTTTKL